MSRKTASQTIEEMKALHRDWLRRISRELDKPLTTVGREAGLSNATLTRFVNNPDHQHALSATSINAIVQAHGVEPPPVAPHQSTRDDYRKAVWNVVAALYEQGALQTGGADATADAVVELADWLLADHEPDEAGAVISFQAERLRRLRAS